MGSSTSAPLDPATEIVATVKAAQLPGPGARRRIRVAAGLTFRQMAQALEVDAMTVWRWENGKTKPKLADAARYRRLLDALEEAVAP